MTLAAPPPLPPGATAAGTVAAFTGAGGRTLRYRAVEAATPARHRILYLHGIESHGTWFLPAALRLRELGCTTWLLDRRGSGLNRETAPGDAGGARILLEDIRRFRAAAGDPPLHVVGLSWGGKLATAAAIDRPAGVRSLVLITPGLRSLVDLSPAAKAWMLAGLLAGGRNRVKVPIEPEMFTRTPDYLEFIRTDPWRLTRVTGRFLLAGLALDRMVARGLPALDLPVLLFLAGGERIIDNDGVLRLLERLPAGRLQVRRYEDATHSIQFDQVDRLVADLAAHLEAGERIAC